MREDNPEAGVQVMVAVAEAKKMAMEAIDRIGEPFRAAVQNKAQRKGYCTFWYAVYRCQCGRSFACQMRHVESGRIVSCGCHKSMVSAHRLSTHGHSETSEYHIWTGIIKRCENPNSSHFKHYGGRGISICKEWRESFEAFLSHVGKRPSDKHSIDRIDVNGNYEPGNVRWATTHEQARNRRNTRPTAFNGRIFSVNKDACAAAGVSTGAVYHRMKAGMSQEEAMSKPVKKSRKWNAIEIDGRVTSITAECALRGLKYSTVMRRISHHGWSVQKALEYPVKKRATVSE